jgi:hypothetical protein
VSGLCELCEPNQQASTLFTGIAVVIAIIVGMLWYYFLIVSNRTLVEAAAYEDERREIEREKFELKKEMYILEGKKIPQESKSALVAADYGDQDDGVARYARYFTIFGPPVPSPDYVFKLKIMLGFIQSVTNVNGSLDIAWPQTFTNFLYQFNPANLDFVQFTNVDCIDSNVDYIYKVYAWAIVLPCVCLALFVFYLLPDAASSPGIVSELLESILL